MSQSHSTTHLSNVPVARGNKYTTRFIVFVYHVHCCLAFRIMLSVLSLVVVEHLCLAFRVDESELIWSGSSCQAGHQLIIRRPQWSCRNLNLRLSGRWSFSSKKWLHSIIFVQFIVCHYKTYKSPVGYVSIVLPNHAQVLKNLNSGQLK